MRKILIGVGLAIAGSLVPAAAEPLRAQAGSYESVSTMYMTLFDVQGPTASQRIDIQWFNVTATNTIEYANGTATPSIDVKVDARWNNCTVNYSLCSTIVVPQRIASPTAIVTDPVANTVRIRATVDDTSNVQHVIDLTFSRPSGPFNPNFGVPNAWLDPATNTAYASTPYLSFYRYGYTATGTFDGFTAAAPPAGCTVNCNYVMSNGYSRALFANATVND